MGKGCELNLEKLIATRMLINANSGGGKSFAIRRLLEQTHGKVQQIVLDLEGEFITLREKYDYLLVGKNGEIPVHIRTAELLARRLLELNVSTIIDLSELEKPQRITFVQRFLDSLLDSPQNLWHPCIIIVDEAHQFCPEGAKSESAPAVIDLMTRGRKRGFCGVLATQRISKLHKDAAAEANNYLTGRTGLDIDMKRAAELLGFTNKEDMRSLRDLKEGEFYAFGSAFTNSGVEKIMVGGVNTTHPDRTKGIQIKGASKTPENIKKLLKDVADLPKEADEELKTKQDMENKIRELKTKLTVLERSKPKPEVDEKSLQIAQERGYRQAENQYKGMIKEFEGKYNLLQKRLNDVARIVGGNLPKMPELSFQIKPHTSIRVEPPKPHTSHVERKIPIVATYGTVDSEIALGLAEKKIYSLISQYPDKVFSKAQVGVFTGYSHTSGGFSNAISRLSQLGLIKRNGDAIQINEINPELTGHFDFSKEAIIGKLGKCEKEIYEILLDNPNDEFTLEVIAEMTPSQYKSSSGGFNNSISRLNTFGLLIRNKGIIRLNPELLEI